MISSVLSRVFFWSFLIILIGGLAAMIGQATNISLPVKIANSFILNFSRPGILVLAKRTNPAEKEAPDTTIRYSFQKDAAITATGAIPKPVYMNDEAFETSRQAFQKMMAAKLAAGEQLSLDTQSTVIRQEGYPADGNNSMAKTAALANSNAPSNMISQEGRLWEQLRVRPAGSLQSLAFALYNFLNMACYAFFFLVLSRLFRNFYNREYFTAANTLLLKRAGWLLMAPQLLALLVYYSFLDNIHPVKLLAGAAGQVSIVAAYDIIAGIDCTMIILALALLVLSYIFSNGLKLKQENALII